MALIISIVLITGYGPGHNPPLINYGAFCGVGGLFFAFIGMAALFFDAIKGVVILALDSIASFFLLAGGLVRIGRISSMVHILTCHT